MCAKKRKGARRTKSDENIYSQRLEKNLKNRNVILTSKPIMIYGLESIALIKSQEART